MTSAAPSTAVARDTSASVRPYGLDEVVKTLNGVVASDWKEFFAARIDRVQPEVPLGGLANAGYRTAFVEKKPELVGAREAAYKSTSVWDSLGFALDKDDVARDVLDGGPAAKAGLIPNAKIIAIDHRRYTTENLDAALARAKSDKKPIELIVEKDDTFDTLSVDWYGGQRWRVIERVEGKPDVLGAILAPKVK